MKYKSGNLYTLNGISKTGRVMCRSRLPKLKYDFSRKTYRLYYNNGEVYEHVVFKTYLDFLNSKERKTISWIGFAVPKEFDSDLFGDLGEFEPICDVLKRFGTKNLPSKYMKRSIVNEESKERHRINMKYFVKHGDFFQFFSAYMSAGLGRNKELAKEEFKKMRKEMGLSELL